MTTVDFHSHILHGGVFDVAADHTVMAGYGARSARPLPGDFRERQYQSALSAGEYLGNMDARGIDLSVLSSSSVVQGTAWADLETDRWAHQTVNDHIAQWRDAHPARFVASFSLPLQDKAASLAELDRAVTDLDSRVANVPANVNGTYLGDPPLDWFWQAVRERGVAVFIHPDGVVDPWFQRYGMWNSVGQPIEEARVMSSLIYNGILERMPEVPIVISHGGGYLPHYMGRHDRNVRNMPDSGANIKRLPSEYLRNVYYDTCVYDPSVLQALTKIVGPDRLVLGSDYPFGDTDPIGFIRTCDFLTLEEMAAILGGTAERILGRS